jgi:two-component system nitrogen regulation sensor histidine kinase NtrY
MTSLEPDKTPMDPDRRRELRRKRRRMERTLIGVALLLILGLTGLQSYVINLSADVPRGHGLLIFSLINVNIILLIVLLFLVLRNLYKIFFEQKQVLRGQLRTKLIVAFLALSFLPTILLFFAAFQFINTGHDFWFNENVEQSLVDSLALAQFLSDVNERQVHDFGEVIRDGILSRDLMATGRSEALDHYLNQKRQQYRLALARAYRPDLTPAAASTALDLDPHLAGPLTPDLFELTLEQGPRSRWDADEEQDLIRVVWPLEKGGELLGFLVVGNQTPAPVMARKRAVEEGLAGYQALKSIHDPIRVSHYIALTIVAVVSILMSTWIGFHLARGITGPIMELAQATERIAAGDYDFTIQVRPSDDEIKTLVDSFNRMTRDLKSGRERISAQNLELMDRNLELDRRRRYIETILQSVAAGVVSVDPDGKVATVNNSAEEILGVRAGQLIGRPLEQVIWPNHRDVLEQLLTTAARSPRASAERQVNLKIGEESLILHVHLSRLKDESGRNAGMVVVFDDLTELVKAQRMAAWREVARRIAHEIKNPLTPIQLSTQRLRRRYADRLSEDGETFEECTQLIVRQVAELKRLVDEFSKFARMPEAVPTPNDLAEIIDETLVLYHEAQKNIEFLFTRDDYIPIFDLDREQIGRALYNLLDNAVAAVGESGRIEINLNYDSRVKLVRLEVADNGAGLSWQARDRLFEPYFSTKKSGTGLGLAIVSSIVADHDGFVRVQDNQPQGARFIIELPVKRKV